MPGCAAWRSGWRSGRQAGTACSRRCSDGSSLAAQPPGADLDLAAALRRLPPQQRAAVALHYYEDRPLAEVAQILNCSHATAKVHVFKARRRLATLLGQPESEGDDAA